jgi:hypothetical protein
VDRHRAPRGGEAHCGGRDASALRASSQARSPRERAISRTRHHVTPAQPRADHADSTVSRRITRCIGARPPAWDDAADAHFRRAASRHIARGSRSVPTRARVDDAAGVVTRRDPGL